MIPCVSSILSSTISPNHTRRRTIYSQSLCRYEGNAKHLSPISLAFVGDGVFEILVRENLLRNGDLTAGKLHQRSVDKVNASAQAKGYDDLIDILTEDETAILRRGRNANVSRIPKTCTVEEYHKATALEALFGYLYLAGENTRILELYDHMMKQQEN